MKRIVLMIAFVATIFSTQAWTGVVDNASYIIAKKYMTPQALAEYNRVMALKSKVEYKWSLDKEARAALTADLKSVTTSEKDIVVRLEKAVDVLRNSAKHSEREQFEALMTLRKLIVELHTISRIAIDGIAQSQYDFKFTWTAGKEGSKKHEKRGTVSWMQLWSSNFCYWHQAWSSDYYAYDIDLRFGKLREEAMKGDFREWAHQMGVVAKPMYEWAMPDMVLAHKPRLLLEDLHLEMVGRAGYRLAAIMNTIVK